MTPLPPKSWKRGWLGRLLGLCDITGHNNGKPCRHCRVGGTYGKR